MQYPIICRETFWTVVPAFCVLTCAELWTLLLFPNKPIQETGGSSLQLFNMICLLVFIAERCLLGSIFWELFHYTTQWQSHLSAWIHSLPFSIRQYLSTKILSSKTLGHVVWNNKHWSYRLKASFLALPAKLFFWGNMLRQDAPPFPSQWPPSLHLSENEGPLSV